MSKLRILAVATAVGLVATTAASATTLDAQTPTLTGPHPEFSITTEGTLLPPIGGGVDAKPYGFWPPTETY